MLPKILKTYNGGTTLINEPVLLNKEQKFDIGTSYPYALSFWVNMESVPPEFNESSAIYANVLSCGDNVKCQYNNSLNKLKVMFSMNGQPVFIENTLRPQRWNHLGIINNGTIVDVYINGQLKNTISTISKIDTTLTVGEDNGIAGEICNLMYYNTSVSPLTIQQIYHQFKELDPPVY